MRLFPEPRKIIKCGGTCEKNTRVEAFLVESGLPPQGYRLTIGPKRITLEGADSAGLFYGGQTVEQILSQADGEALPCLEVQDWPDFRRRAYMLDISRDRVPTMVQLFHLIDQLAALRYNELQLYTEHSFAYAQHPVVWQKASPMKPEELRELDHYSRERKIELIPNQNSFGHMERWLQHPEYHHLAECPNGFAHPLGGWREHGSVLRPEAASLDFLDGLYRELLPNFTSKRFNIGGDEPWELGQGATRSRVEREGKYPVYLDFLSQVCRLAENYGVEPMCWADVLLESPEAVRALPSGITPILWGYEVEHPFDKQCELLAGLDRNFYVAPGDSTWNSHTGRGDVMAQNIRAAAVSGLRHGAAGFMLAHWGDGGHPQPWVVGLPGMVWGGLNAWNVEAAEQGFSAAMEFALDESDRPKQLAELLRRAGQLDAALQCPLPNKSFLAHSLHLNEVALRAFEPKPSEKNLRQQIVDCDSLLNSCGEDGLSEELALALRMNRFAAYRCLGELDQRQGRYENLVIDFKKQWLRRSREGGLKDSLGRMPGLTAL